LRTKYQTNISTTKKNHKRVTIIVAILKKKIRKGGKEKNFNESFSFIRVSAIIGYKKRHHG